MELLGLEPRSCKPLRRG